MTLLRHIKPNLITCPATFTAPFTFCLSFESVQRSVSSTKTSVKTFPVQWTRERQPPNSEREAQPPSSFFNDVAAKWRQSRHTVITQPLYISPVISCKKWIWIANDTRAPIRKGKALGDGWSGTVWNGRAWIRTVYTPTRKRERERERFSYSHYSLFPTCTATYRTNYRFRDRLRPRSRKSPEIPE